MYKVIEVSSTPILTNYNSGSLQSRDGFQEHFNEALRATDKKQAFKDKTYKENRLYQLNNSVDQLVHSGKKLNASNLENNRISAGMLNLYIAQERKDEKSGRGRVILGQK